ncbi:flippase-like domain-containing protein [bacterium]|nr:flippase-like domain-containing protein [bacterium]
MSLSQIFGSTSLTKAINVSTVYVGFTYVAPTPGAAGLAEASGAAFFRGILPEKKAVLVVLLFRVLTSYFQVVFGLIYLGFVGCVKEILQKKQVQILRS